MTVRVTEVRDARDSDTGAMPAPGCTLATLTVLLLPVVHLLVHGGVWLLEVIR